MYATENIKGNLLDLFWHTFLLWASPSACLYVCLSVCLSGCLIIFVWVFLSPTRDSSSRYAGLFVTVENLAEELSKLPTAPAYCPFPPVRHWCCRVYGFFCSFSLSVHVRLSLLLFVFLDESMHLYMRVCPSIGPTIIPSTIKRSFARDLGTLF